MNIKLTAEGKITIFKIQGRVDAKTSGILGNKLSSLLGKNPILIDMSGLTFIGSSGIGKLLTMIKNAKSANTKIALCSIPVRFKPVFDTAKITSLLPIYANPDKARNAFGGDDPGW